VLEHVEQELDAGAQAGFFKTIELLDSISLACNEVIPPILSHRALSL